MLIKNPLTPAGIEPATFMYINKSQPISLVLLFQYLPATFNFSPISSQSFGLRSLLR